MTNPAKSNLSPAKQALLEKWLQGQTKMNATTIPPRQKNKPVLLSFPQQRQLFLELLERGTAVNNLSVLLEFKGLLNIDALQQSANQILARHEILRTRFVFGLGMPTPEVADVDTIAIPVIELHTSGETEQLQEARRMAEQEVLHPFDLTQVPLMRLKLYLTGSDKNFLLVVAHHTIADGWSLGVFLQELIRNYQHITAGWSTPLAELRIQYADFAEWQVDPAREEILQSSIQYWKKQLDGELPVLELPTDHPRGARQTFIGGTYRFLLHGELTAALEGLGRQENATLYMVLLTAFTVLLHRYSGQEDVIIGTPIANRNFPELEPLIGVFINTIALRATVSGNPGFRDLLRRMRDLCLDAYQHQDLPFEKLVEELKPKRDLSRTPVFQVVFNLQNSPMPKLEIPGLSIRPLEIDRGVSQFDLTLMVTRQEGQCHCTVEYNRDLFSPETVARMFRSFEKLISDAVTQPEIPVSSIQLTAKDELDRFVDVMNRTFLDFPRNTCVHQLFEAQASRTPDAVAVMYEDIALSYRELNRRANKLACYLRTLGVGPDIRVGIFMEKSTAIIEALLAVLKAGGTYVPMHTSYPAERVQFILDEADIKVLLTNIESVPWGKVRAEVIHVGVEKNTTEDDDANPELNISPDHLAYIIFTSGSTGQPKGVMVHHTPLVNFLWSMRMRPGIRQEDVLLAITSLSFDIAVLELFLPLITGATVVIVGQETTTNPFLLSEAIRRYRISMMQATPPTWQLLIDSGWKGEPGLIALCGGDFLSRKLADQLLDRVGILWNMYGPTETTVWSSAGRVRKGNEPVSIGHPIGNTQLYVLDRYLQPVPPGVVGELYIGGDGLARGYLNNTRLTDEKFIPDCISNRPGMRMYRTGDHARYVKEGSIEVIGRMDDQVKLYGHRIELGEITHVMMQHPGVQEAFVVMRTEQSDEKRLVAYFVPHPDVQFEVSVLQDFVRSKLPAYMIPVVFIPLHSLPLSAHGKIDRKALPIPEDIRPLAGYVAPRTKTEEVLAGIWQEVLHVEQVGIHDNFFDLGGASIQSLQVVAYANMAGLRISAEHIFEFQTIIELAGHIENE